MDCEQTRELLSEYAEDLLPLESQGQVDTHLSTCEACARELASLQAYLKAMRGLPRVPAPVGFVDAVRRRLDTPPSWRRWFSAISSPLFSGTPLRVAGLVTSVLLVTLVYHQVSRRDQILELGPPRSPVLLEHKVSQDRTTAAPAPAPILPSGLADSGGPPDDFRELPANEFASPAQGMTRSAESHVSRAQETARAKTSLTPRPLAKSRDKRAAAPPALSVDLVIVVHHADGRDAARTRAAPPPPASSPKFSGGRLRQTELSGASRAEPQSHRRDSEFPPSTEPEPNGHASVVQQAVDALRRLLPPVSGTIQTMEQSTAAPNRASITVSLPAQHYPRFIRDLETLGTLTSDPLKKSPPGNVDPVSIRVVLLAE